MKNKKTLQKLTDYKNLNSLSELKKYLKLYPNKKVDIIENIRVRLIDSYKNEEKNEYNLTEMYVSLIENKELKKDIRNTTYEVNHSIITSFMNNYILEYKQFPTMSVIAEQVHLSRQTIYNHFNNGLMTINNRLLKGKNEIMSLKALEKLYLIGIEKNNPIALKYFIQLTGMVSNNNSMQVNNYIQVNNLKISNEDIKRLPVEDILQIEKIISKTLIIE